MELCTHKYIVHIVLIVIQTALIYLFVGEVLKKNNEDCYSKVALRAHLINLKSSK